MEAVDTWATRHQALIGLLIVLWPLISGVVNWIFKPRTHEQYLAMPHRVAGFLEFFASAGFDPRGALSGAYKLLTGLSKAPPPPPPPPQEPPAPPAVPSEAPVTTELP